MISKDLKAAISYQPSGKGRIAIGIFAVTGKQRQL
jgi:hypothetical protein